ncbi:hypothetical protein [Actinacidiphila oryziradicis]|uniref:hypothetical protein n=1 Tax=Actinacidiphila oryziradicis TaxID=2571141 RepID=UPI0023F2696F|nr:hypothetical protein [Actinacidiphila oryziradicis]
MPPWSSNPTRTSDTLLRAAADGCARCPALSTRDLVHRVGLLLGRSTEGAACFDRRLVQLATGSPGFTAELRGWLESDAPGWDALVGPDARRTLSAGSVAGTSLGAAPPPVAAR